MPILTATRPGGRKRQVVLRDQAQTDALRQRWQADGWQVTEQPTDVEILDERIRQNDQMHNTLVDELVARGQVPGDRAGDLKRGSSNPNQKQE